MSTPENVQEMPLFAWVGEDELGSGEVGLKQAHVPAGYIALVSNNNRKLDRDFVVAQLQQQANAYGKIIRLCRYKFVEEILTLVPESK